MGLKFLGTSVILERRHEQYDLARRVKAHYFESPNKNVVLKTFNDEFHRLTKSQTVTMSRARFDELPSEPEARADRALKLMGWE